MEQQTGLVRLGAGEVFVARTTTGEIELVQSNVELSERRKEIIKIAGNWTPSKRGCIRLHQMACIHFISLPIYIDGRETLNPYREINPRTGAVMATLSRRIGVGYGPTGIPCVIEKSIRYDIHTYLIQEIQSKMKKYPGIGVLGHKDKRPNSKRWEGTVWSKEEKRLVGNGKFREQSYDGHELVFHEITDPVGIWLDLFHPETPSIYEGNTHNQKFGDRIVQSMVDRNILLEHPCCAAKSVEVQCTPDGDNIAVVAVCGFNNKSDWRKLRKLAELISRGEIMGEEIELQTGIADAEYEVIQDEFATTADDPEDGASPIFVAGEGEAQEPSQTPTEAPQTQPAPRPAPAAPAPVVKPSATPATGLTDNALKAANAVLADKAAASADAAELKAQHESLNTELKAAHGVLGKAGYSATLKKLFPAVKTAVGLSLADKRKLLKALGEAVDKKAVPVE